MLWVIISMIYFRVANLTIHGVDWFTSYLIRALIPYHGHLLLLLNHVVIVVNLCCVDGLMKVDVHLISTLVNKSLHYYYYYYIIATDNELIRASLQLVYKALGHYHLLHTTIITNSTWEYLCLTRILRKEVDYCHLTLFNK